MDPQTLVRRMTLREWVQRGSAGTLAERQDMETGLLRGWHDAEQHGLETVASGACQSDVGEDMWNVLFGFWKELGAAIVSHRR